MLKSPVIKLDKNEKVMTQIFGKKTTPMCLRFMILVAKKSREEYLAYLADEFTKIYKDYQGLLDAWVTTSYEIEEEVRKSILALLKNISGKTIILHEDVNAELLGGFVAKVGDYQYDASIRTSMRKLKEDFSQNLFISKI